METLANLTKRPAAEPRDSKRRGRQTFINGEIHHWYRLVLGYTDQPVTFLLDRLRIKSGDTVLDPFCGTGTTLVECLKKNISCIGVDANPSSCFAARVKTNWRLSPSLLLKHLCEVQSTSRVLLRRKAVLHADPTFRYIDESGMLARGWIGLRALEKTISIKSAIRKLPTITPYRDALMLALLAEVVNGASNVKFGPELYCGPAKPDGDVLEEFSNRVTTMAADLKLTRAITARSTVFQGDSRELSAVLGSIPPVSAVISSPPYPAEHDYTRNARLELAFLEEVYDKQSLRDIKRGMIRCHTKGIYTDDSDSLQVTGLRAVEALARRLDKRARGKTHKFAPLYSAVVEHYFGGMKRHLASLFPYLAPGAKCAYVLGDQAGYLQVHIPTADLLADVAVTVGYEIEDIISWREGRTLRSAMPMHEKILIMRKPG